MINPCRCRLTNSINSGKNILKSVTNIACQKDYYEYLVREFGKPKFIIVEEFLYRELKRNCWDELFIRTTENQSLDFIDTNWNTEISISNISEKYKGCTTRLYRNWGTAENGEPYDKGGRIIFTYNYTEETKERIILYENWNSWSWKHGEKT